MHATLFLIGADGVFDLLCIAFEQAVDEDWLRTARCFDGEIGKANVDEARYQKVWQEHVYALKDIYEMNP